MKVKKVTESNKTRAHDRAYSEKASKLYHAIINNESNTLFSVPMEEIKEIRFTNYGRTILHLAVWHHQNEIVNQICSNKQMNFLINQQDNNGDTPLHLAVLIKNFDAYKILLEAGADLSTQNNLKEQPLQLIQDIRAWKEFLIKVRALSPNLDIFNMVPDIKLNLIPKRSGIGSDLSYRNYAAQITSPSTTSAKNGQTRNNKIIDAGEMSWLLNSPTELNRKGSQNDPRSRLYSGNGETMSHLHLYQSTSIAEDFNDNDSEIRKEFGLSSLVRSKISKTPNTLTKVQVSSLRDNQSSLWCVNTELGAKNCRRYGSFLATKISRETFYSVNKTSPKSIIEPEVFPEREDS